MAFHSGRKEKRDKKTPLIVDTQFRCGPWGLVVKVGMYGLGGIEWVVLVGWALMGRVMGGEVWVGSGDIDG